MFSCPPLSCPCFVSWSVSSVKRHARPPCSAPPLKSLFRKRKRSTAASPSFPRAALAPSARPSERRYKGFSGDASCAMFTVLLLRARIEVCQPRCCGKPRLELQPHPLAPPDVWLPFVSRVDHFVFSTAAHLLSRLASVHVLGSAMAATKRQCTNALRCRRVSHNQALALPRALTWTFTVSAEPAGRSDALTPIGGASVTACAVRPC